MYCKEGEERRKAEPFDDLLPVRGFSDPSSENLIHYSVIDERSRTKDAALKTKGLYSNNDVSEVGYYKITIRPQYPCVIVVLRSRKSITRT